MRVQKLIRASVAGLAVVITPAADHSHGAVLMENFGSDPSTRGWRTFGQADLFHWNDITGALDVTWDSSRTNSYFYRPLQNILTRQDDFTIDFDLYLQDIAIGADTSKPYTFQIAVGLLNFAGAARTNFYRGSGIHAVNGPRSLVEFNYFPDSGFGATVAPTVVSTNNRITFSDNHPLEMTPGNWYHISLGYAASNTLLRTAMTRNGRPFGMPPNQSLAELSLATFPDFAVDTFVVASYSDAGQSPPHFSGSILAHGTVDNVRLTLPPAPVESIRARSTPGKRQVQTDSRSGWTYLLQRTSDFVTWLDVSPPIAGTNGPLVLEDPLPAGGPSFYRVRATRP